MEHTSSLGFFARADDHGAEDCDKFRGFLQQILQPVATDLAGLLQQLKPEQRFIGFLQQAVDLGAKFRIRSGS